MKLENKFLSKEEKQEKEDESFLNKLGTQAEIFTSDEYGKEGFTPMFDKKQNYRVGIGGSLSA